MADFVIGSFNCKWGCLNDDEKREYRQESKNKTISQFIKDEQLDIVALQEYRISDNLSYENEPSKKRFDVLLPDWEICGFSSSKKRGVDFSYEKTEEYSIPARYSYVDNGYAIMWNRKKFELIVSEDWEKKIDLIRKDEKYKIARPPQILRLKYKMGNSKGCEIRIINIHLTYSGKEAKKIYVKENNCWRFMRHAMYPEKESLPIIKRKEELSKCLSIYSKVASITKDALPSLHTILLGDFNLEPNKCNDVLKKSRFALPNYPDCNYLNLQQHKPTTLKRSFLSLSKEGSVYFNKSYDHFIGGPMLEPNPEKPNSDVIDTVSKYFNKKNDIHYLQFSDHVPIKIEVTLP
jgi:endonuclease/exonuclease/phosphatase family metal-dependent hydrolase